MSSKKIFLLKIKRMLDIAVSTIIIILFLPLMVIVSILIWIDDGWPVLFKQKRIGQNCKEFELLKFRSMKVNDIPVEHMGQVREDNPLVTRVGRFIRRFKIDELPQLFNVLFGDMSLIGPRPTIPEQVENYTEFEKIRLLMRPGMTGWAQVNGNTRLSWEERIKLDIWYIEHWSLWLDFLIIIKTIGVIIFGERPVTKAIKEAADFAIRFNRNGREYTHNA
ncbi:MAG: sugar transferase [Tepidanaerobacteraceae bacterium]|jgi:lipopolysaccharide/colanic/teichoic acid biosynthesis glycosyltransferase|nr:sugar transferase [Tepidanaerobacteraceae bacterium]